MPAVTRQVVDHVVVKPARVTWQYRRDLFGRERKCKVVVPAVTRRVVRNVKVSGPRKVARVVPAEYRTVHQRVLLRTARTRSVYQPPVIGVERHRMLVKRGEHRWVRTTSRW